MISAKAIFINYLILAALLIIWLSNSKSPEPGSFNKQESPTKIQSLNSGSNTSNRPDEIKNAKIFVGGGEFIMGCSEDQLAECDTYRFRPHKVSLDSYYLTKFEITNSEYCRFLNAQGNNEEAGRPWLKLADPGCKIIKKNGKYIPYKGYEFYPAVYVSWYGARAYCQWIGGRLPTEAEWEFAARGGNSSKGYLYSGGNELHDVAVWYGNNISGPARVGTKKPNELGFYDMSGNVFEWCHDWYEELYYEYSPVIDPQGPQFGKYRIARGGHWKAPHLFCRIPARTAWNPIYQINKMGFRVCFDSVSETRKL